MKALLCTIILLISVACSPKKPSSVNEKPLNQYDVANIQTIKFIFPYAKEHGLEVLRIGTLSANSQKAMFSCVLKSNQELTLEQAQDQAQYLSTQFGKYIVESEAIAEYLEICKSDAYEIQYAADQIMMGYQIDFWDVNYNRMAPPYIARILCQNSDIQYYQADPVTQKLKCVHTEKYR